MPSITRFHSLGVRQQNHFAGEPIYFHWIYKEAKLMEAIQRYELIRPILRGEKNVREVRIESLPLGWSKTLDTLELCTLENGAERSEAAKGEPTCCFTRLFRFRMLSAALLRQTFSIEHDE